MAKFDFTSFISASDPKELAEYYRERLKINLGCNSDIRPGYLNVDLIDFSELDLRANVSDLDFLPQGEAKEILAYDILEHFRFSSTREVLTRWIDLLAPGGKIIVRVPDMEKIAHKLIDGTLPAFEVGRLLYGGQDYEFNYHMAGFTGPFLEGLILGCGCSEIVQVVREDTSHNVTVVGIK